MSAPGRRFSRDARLTRAAEYKRVFDSACRVTSGNFTFIARQSPVGQARLGLAIAKKHLGSAVARNRVKRLLREGFRHSRQDLPPLDVVVLTRPGIAQSTASELREAIARAWPELARRCGGSSSSRSGPTASS